MCGTPGAALLVRALLCLRQVDSKEMIMNYPFRRSSARTHDGVNSLSSQRGKMGWIVLWALGVPIPVLLIFFLLRGCT
jgi:hypothetical protein